MQAGLEALIRLDLLFETISGILAFIVAHYSGKAYRLAGQKRLADLSTGFLVLSAGMFGRVIGTLYFFVIYSSEGNLIGSASTLIAVVTIAYGVMRIMAYLLFAISTRHTTGNQATPIALFLALPILVDPSLELIAVIVLIIVVLQSAMNYAANRSGYALYVLGGFFLILLSHILAIMAQTQGFGYIASQFLQLLGFLAFVVMLGKVGQE